MLWIGFGGLEAGGMDRTRGSTVATRIAVMAAGLVLVGEGIALAKVSETGVAPFSCPAAVCTYIARNLGNETLTMGLLSFLISSLCFFVEIALLRKRFNPRQVFQISALMLMTATIDVWIGLFSNVDMTSPVVRLAFLGASLLVLSLGIHLEVAANVVMIPGDAMVATISYVTQKPYSKVKIAVDCMFALTGLVLSLVWFHGIVGVGLGTVASAVCVGTFIRMWSRVLAPFEARLDLADASVLPSVVPETY
jgi:uncharacterized membrane protein YczE